jgi:hypothetical protein
MQENIKKHLLRLGYKVVESKEDYVTERNGKKFVIPAELYSIIETLKTNNQELYCLYEEYKENVFRYTPIDFEYALADRHFSGGPYISLFEDENYLMIYLISVNDANPSNPEIFYVSDLKFNKIEDSEETLEQFFAQLFTKAEIDSMVPNAKK